MFRLRVLLFLCFCVIPNLSRPGFVPAAEDDVISLVRSSAPDWPQWQGPCRDGVSDETGLLATWPRGGPKLLWTASGIGRGYSSPIVVGDTVYITGDEGDKLIVTALALDGSRRWRSTNGAAWEASYPGARASCCYDEGLLYHMNAHGRLVCLEAATGAEKWAVNTLERFGGQNILWGVCESVTVHGDHVLAAPFGRNGAVVALDKKTGDIAWSSPPLDNEHGCYCSPILVSVGSRVLLVYSASKHVFAVDIETGKLLWQVAQADPKNTVSSTPVLADDQLIIGNSSRGFGAVFGMVFDDKTAEKTWQASLSVSHRGIVSMGDGTFASSSRGTRGGWVGIDADTGKTSLATEGPAGSLIYADKRFYCLSDNGTMTLFKLAGETFESAGSFQFVDEKDVWAHPVICHGRLYLRWHDSISCYDIRL